MHHPRCEQHHGRGDEQRARRGSARPRGGRHAPTPTPRSGRSASPAVALTSRRAGDPPARARRTAPGARTITAISTPRPMNASLCPPFTTETLINGCRPNSAERAGAPRPAPHGERARIRSRPRRRPGTRGGRGAGAYRPPSATPDRVQREQRAVGSRAPAPLRADEAVQRIVAERVRRVEVGAGVVERPPSGPRSSTTTGRGRTSAGRSPRCVAVPRPSTRSAPGFPDRVPRGGRDRERRPTAARTSATFTPVEKVAAPAMKIVVRSTTAIECGQRAGAGSARHCGLVRCATRS